jgi:hypothetical protein
MHNRIWGRVVLALSLPAVSLFGSVIETYNAGQPQAFNTYWGVTDIGWYYTPLSSYSLDGIETTFTQSTYSGDVDRVVTVAIFTKTPATGGVELGFETFNTSTARSGVYSSALFSSPVALTVGTTYFVAIENVLDLGVNQVSDTSSGGNAGPPGSVALGTTWADSDGGAQFGTEASPGNTWFDKPVIEFLTPTVSGVPEPGSWVLTALPAVLLFWRLRKRAA